MAIRGKERKEVEKSGRLLADTILISEFYEMKKQKQPIRILLTWIRGAVGKDFVIKHYRYGVVKTRFPDMTKIIASAQQRKCRNLFKEAVAYARIIYADPVKRKEWAAKTRKKHRVINFIIKQYMLAAKEAALKRQEIATVIIRRCFEPRQAFVEVSLPEWNNIPATARTVAPG